MSRRPIIFTDLSGRDVVQVGCESRSTHEAPSVPYLIFPQTRGNVESMFTPQQAAEFEKHTLDFIAGFQELAKFHRTDSPEYREAWAKTQAAKEAIDTLIALTSTNQ